MASIKFDDFFTTDPNDKSSKTYIPKDDVNDAIRGLGKYKYIPDEKIVFPKTKEELDKIEQVPKKSIINTNLVLCDISKVASSIKDLNPEMDYSDIINIIQSSIDDRCCSNI